MIVRSRIDAVIKMVDEGIFYKTIAELIDIGEATLYHASARQREDTIIAVLPR